MAVAIQVAGLATIKVGTGAAGALEILGYTVNGAEITLEQFSIDVPGDQNGGDDGPPIDVQNLGQIARIRLELTKWNETIADKCKCRERGGTAGVIPVPGHLWFASSLDYRLLISTATALLSYNFSRAIPLGTIDINKGTKFSRMVMEWIAYKGGDDGTILYDTTVD